MNAEPDSDKPAPSLRTPLITWIVGVALLWPAWGVLMDSAPDMHREWKDTWLIVVYVAQFACSIPLARAISASRPYPTATAVLLTIFLTIVGVYLGQLPLAALLWLTWPRGY